mgnify:CR=1 FL=1
MVGCVIRRERSYLYGYILKPHKGLVLIRHKDMSNLLKNRWAQALTFESDFDLRNRKFLKWLWASRFGDRKNVDWQSSYFLHSVVLKQ